MNLGEPEGIQITPSPAFVIKTRDKASGRKIFINLCSSDLVEAPHAKSLPDSEGQQAVRIPISVGERYEETDKSGEPCDCFDLIISSKSVTEADKDVEFKNMVCQIALSALGQKYKLEPDEKFTLPKLKYKSTTCQIRAQRIRVKKESQIQEIFEDVQKPAAVEEPVRNIPPFTITYHKPEDTIIDGLLLSCYKSVSAELRDNLRSKLSGTADAEATESIEGSMCRIKIPLGNSKSAKCKISAECLAVSFSGVSRVFDDFSIFFPIAFSSASARAFWENSNLCVEISTS